MYGHPFVGERFAREQILVREDLGVSAVDE